MKVGFGPAAASQLINALLFLGLIDSDGAPKPALRMLVASFETEKWPVELETVLRGAYSAIFEISLEKAALQQVSERFRTAYSLQEPTCRKSVEFFLNALRETEVILSSNLSSRAYSNMPVAQLSRAPDQLAIKLLEKLPPFDSQWPDSIKESWLKGFVEIAQRTKGRG